MFNGYTVGSFLLIYIFIKNSFDLFVFSLSINQSQSVNLLYFWHQLMKKLLFVFSRGSTLMEIKFSLTRSGQGNQSRLSSYFLSLLFGLMLIVFGLIVHVKFLLFCYLFYTSTIGKLLLFVIFPFCLTAHINDSVT